ncbi:MAG TPA: hypothetical protein VF099_19405, partial [Ktedonobacterales bacterium]
GLSKAQVTRYVGAKDGLASERAYTSRMLPLGVARGMRDGLLRLDLAGFARAGAITSGLFLTILGYAVGWFLCIRKGEAAGKEGTVIQSPATPELKQKGVS